MEFPKYGDAGTLVLSLQTNLLLKKFSPGPLDGIFGPKTKAAVSKFQKSIGLMGSGIIGPKTMAALGVFADEVEEENGPITGLVHHNVKTPRTLPSALEALIDKEVEKNFMVEYVNAMAEKDFGALMVICAKAMNNLKIREATNKNDGYLVELIQKISGGKRGYAWCMYAVQVCVAWCEHKLGIVSKFPSSGSCASVRSRCPASIQVDKEDSIAGDIWIWRYTSTGLGHTGVFSKWISPLSKAELYEGNTSQGLGADGKIDREGGGFYKTNRAYAISGMSLAMVVRAA